MKASRKAGAQSVGTRTKQNPGRIPEGRGGSGAYTVRLTRAGEVVKSYSYDPGTLDDLEASFSPERMSTYRKAVEGDREQAIHLYTWNAAMSAAFYGPLQGLEVALRNTMHRQLSRCYGAAWYENPKAGLDSGCLARIDNARNDVANAGHPVSPGRIVAAVSFGFWIALLGPGGRTEATGVKADYESTLWRPALRKAFPHREVLTRKQAQRPLNDLRILRNRIAHHEPIFARPLTEDYERILDVAGWISPGTRKWIEGHSRVATLLEPSNFAKDVPF